MARATGHRPNRYSCSTLEQIQLLLGREERERTGLFWAEGCRSFFSALEHGWTIRSVVYCPKLLKSAQAWQRLRSIDAPKLRLRPDEFRLLTRREQPDGIGVVLRAAMEAAGQIGKASCREREWISGG